MTNQLTREYMCMCLYVCGFAHKYEMVWILRLTKCLQDDKDDKDLGRLYLMKCWVA